MIVYDNSATSTDQTASPITWNHTCVGASNALLVLGIGVKASTGQPSVSAVTYNGVSMTKVRGDQNGGLVQLSETSIWFLFAPAAGTNQVSATFSGGTVPHGAGVSVSYKGAQQLNTADASNGSTGTATGDQTFSVTSIASNSWEFAVAINEATSAATATADQTSRGSVALAGATSGIVIASDTNGMIVPAGSNTMGFNVNGTGEAGWAMSGATFAPIDRSFRPNYLKPAIFKPGATSYGRF